MSEGNFLVKLWRKLFNPVSIHQVYKYLVVSNSGAEYIVLIETEHRFNIESFKDSKVRVFCGCSDFMYRAAFNLNKFDNLYINNSTKEYLGDALITKPTKVVTTPICKHTYACLFDLRDNFNKYNKWT
jgi:hypothetical protein